MRRAWAILILTTASCAGLPLRDGVPHVNWRVVTRPANETPVALDFNPATPLHMIVIEPAESPTRRGSVFISSAVVSVGFDFAVSQAAPEETIEGEVFLRDADPARRYEVRLFAPEGVGIEGPNRFVMGAADRRKVRVKASLQLLSRIRADARELGGEMFSEDTQ